LICDLPFKMFFVGTGYAAEEMKNLVAELGLTDKVVFTGMLTDREQLKQYYAASDLFIFPSIYDNAPLVVREAGALGTPTVMVSGSTAAEILTDNVNGFLIDNTPEALAARLRELYSDRERMKDVGLSASKTIARSWKDIVNEEVLDRYMSLIKRKQKKNAASGITI
jgi:1,2-diacylglycerol 3-alpha-glucosyltransferase